VFFSNSIADQENRKNKLGKQEKRKLNLESQENHEGFLVLSPWIRRFLIYVFGFSVIRGT
jgi:hypothetical protein